MDLKTTEEFMLLDSLFLLKKELQRYLLLKQFKNECSNILNTYETKQTQQDIYTSIFPKWFMNNKNDLSKDPVIPYNPTNFDQLQIDLKNVYNITKTAELIYKLDIKNKCNKMIENMATQNNIINNIDPKIEKLNNYIYFTIIINKSPINLNLTKMGIHKNCYKKLKNKYINKYINKTDLYNLIFAILIRYNTLESNNQQLAVLPDFYTELYNLGFNCELFASSLNCHAKMKYFCSLYPDLDKYFNCIGNFNTIHINNYGELFVANPPFDESIMLNMSIKLVKILQQKLCLNIFLTIPVWDEKPEYGDYKALTVLKRSNYIKYLKKIDKRNALFFDYYANRYITPCKIYFILLQNNSGEIKYPKLKNTIVKLINKYFIESKYSIIKPLIGGNNDKNNMIIIKTIHHIKKQKFKVNLIYKKNPSKYIIEHNISYYLPIKYNTKMLIYEYISSMEPILLNILSNKHIDNILLIDFTNITVKDKSASLTYIYDRLKWNFNALFTILLKINPFYNINIKYLLEPPQDSKDLNNKYDLIFLSGNIEYNKLLTVKYFQEHFNHILHIKQMIYLLNFQKIGGTCIYLISTCNTLVYHQIITLLNNYYKTLYLFKNKRFQTSLTYIICSNFLGISNKDMTKLNNTNKKLTLLNQNIFDQKLRIQFNINNTIDYNTETDLFLHNFTF